MKISKRKYKGYVYDVSVKKNENLFMNNILAHNCGIWQGKKKYALMVHDSEGVRYPKPKMKVKGLELVKSSTPAIIRGKLKEAVFLLLNDENKLINFLSDMKKEFKKYKPEQIAFPRGVGTLNKYTPKPKAKQFGMFGIELDQPIYMKGSPIAVRGALLYNDYIKKQNLLSNFPEIREGDKVKFIYLKLPNPIKEDVISFLRNIPNRDNFMKYFDYSTQYYKVFVKPIQALCDSVNIDVLSVDKVDLTKVFGDN